eukprot:scaffold2853_cov108-Skeletonema_marinoi.AAC.6
MTHELIMQCMRVDGGSQGAAFGGGGECRSDTVPTSGAEQSSAMLLMTSKMLLMFLFSYYSCAVKFCCNPMQCFRDIMLVVAPMSSSAQDTDALAGWQTTYSSTQADEFPSISKST